MYSQANVRAGKWPRPPPRALPSVIVDTVKVLREADGPEESDFHLKKSASGGKVFVPGCASKPDGESREEPEEHKRYTTPIGDKRYCRKSSAQSKGRHLCCIVAIGSK